MKVLNWFSMITIFGIFIFISPIVASEQAAQTLIDINNSAEISNKILLLKSENGTCTASIVNYNTQRYLITAAHCLPKSSNEIFLNVYEGIVANIENNLSLGKKIKLSDLTNKTRLLISNGFKNMNLDIYVLPLKDNQLDLTPSFEIRLSELTNQENVRPFGYPESSGPFGSECVNQGGYVASPRFEFPSYRPIIELFCKDSQHFSMFNGMSGGPVIDSNGYFVGLMSAGARIVDNKLNYVQIIPSVVVMDAITLKEVETSFKFIDYQFSTKDANDRQAMYKGYNIGTFIDINRLGGAPNIFVSFLGNPLEISKIVTDFNRKDLQITLQRSSPNSSSFFYEIRRQSDGQVLEHSTVKLSILAFKDFRRWISKKVEKYL